MKDLCDEENFPNLEDDFHLVYKKNRLISFLDSETGTYNFQSDKALESITSGGFFGKGIGEGTLKNRVPEAHADYIISVISEFVSFTFVVPKVFTLIEVGSAIPMA